MAELGVAIQVAVVMILVALTTCQLDSGEMAALAELKRELHDQAGSSFLTSWDLAANDVCGSFAGIVCEQGHVVQLNLGDASSAAGLRGRLSPWIANLTMLRQVTLVPGAVTGRLPDTLGRLQALEFVGMSRNRLEGCIPMSVSHMSRLQVLDLSSNQLECGIPPSLGRLVALEVLDLSHNRLTGSVPSLASSVMTHLDLTANRLTGQLPAWLPPTLAYLAISDNQLSGTLASLAPLRRLVNCDLSNNRLSGSIPKELLTENVELLSLLLQRNQLTGPILPVGDGDDDQDVDMSSIGRLDLSFNYLSGSIPAALAGMRGSLLLNNNRLSGQVPAQFATAQLQSLYLQHNFLTRFPPLSAAASLVCLEYNCLEPPPQSVCAAKKPSGVARPTSQCSNLN